MLKKDLVLLLSRIASRNNAANFLPDDLAKGIANALEQEDGRRTIPNEIHDFVVLYYDWLGNHGGKKRRTKKEYDDAELTLYRLVTIDSYSFLEEIVPALRWAVQDRFWSAQVRSIAHLRSKSKNGETKFSNLFSAYTAANTSGLISVPQNRKEAVNDERTRRAEERLRRRAEAGAENSGGATLSLE